MFLEVSLQVEKGLSDCHGSVVQNHPLPIYLTNPKHLRNLLASEVYHHVCSGMIQSLCMSHSGPLTHSAKVQGFRNGWGRDLACAAFLIQSPQGAQPTWKS